MARDNTTIGGTAAGAANLISGNLRGGLGLASSGNVVQGNFIGTDSTGTIDLGNGNADSAVDTVGISVTGFPGNNTIGGTAAGAGNVIAFTKRRLGSEAIGVRVAVTGATGNSILGNSIFGNEGPGLRVNVGNPPPPVPVLTSATATTITGTLAGPASTTFRIEFFATPDTGPDSNEQGKTLLGTIDVTTDVAGNASYSLDSPGGVPAGQFITATATDQPTGTTGNFSAPITNQAPAAADLSVAVTDAPDPVLAGNDLTYTITVSNVGPDAAANVTLSDAVPANTTFVSFTSPAGWTASTPAAGGTGMVSATNPSLASGATATFTLVVRVDPSISDGTTISDTVTVAADTADSNTGNNTAITTTQVSTLPTPEPTPTPTPDAPPIVVSVQRFGFHAQPTFLVLTFSEALDPARAADPANYLVRGRGRAVAVASAAYDDATRSVTLRMARRVSLWQPFRLTVVGTGTGLADLQSNLLDGDGDGRPSGDQVFTLNRTFLAGPAGDGGPGAALARLRARVRGPQRQRT